MRKIILGMLSVLAVVAGLYLGKESLVPKQDRNAEKTVHFYNWGDYIDPDLLKQFEEEMGYHIVYDTFDSNEAMMTKIEQGGTDYDLVVPSDYMLNNMIKHHLLLPLDHEKLPNFKYMDNRLLNLDFDLGNKYSVPYFWGTLGILYDTRRVSPEEITSWKDLWNPKWKNSLLVIDGAREMLGVSLQSLGYSVNEVDDTKLEEASQQLKALMPNIQALITDEIKMYMIQGQAPLAVTFSGEAAMAMEKAPYLAYSLPKEGSNIWFDNLAIPKTAHNLEGAYALMNFLMRPDVAAKNAGYIGYSTPNKAAKEQMDPDQIKNSMFYPSEEVMSRLEIYKDLGQERLIYYNDLFLEDKLSQ